MGKKDGVIQHLRQICRVQGIEMLNKELEKGGFGDFSLSEIAYIMGITAERVRQIETMAIKKLRAPSIGKRLKDKVYDYGGVDDYSATPHQVFIN